MNYSINGKIVPVAEIYLNAGESVYTQSGSMAYQSAFVDMKTNARGGFAKSLGRLFTGESVFMVNYTALRDGQCVAFAATVPGSIMVVDLAAVPGGLVLQKGAFLCAQQTVNLSLMLAKRFSAGLFGGEGFVLQKAQGTGLMFLEIDGDCIEKQLAPGEVLKVDTGNVVAFEPSVGYEVETVKGLGNILLGGEGLFLTKLTGPGRVILQSQNFIDFARRIAPFVAPSK